MSVKLLTAHHLEIQSLKWGCIGLSASTLVKMHFVGILMPQLVSLPHFAVDFSAVCDSVNFGSDSSLCAQWVTQASRL